MILAINSYLKYHNIHLTSQKLKSHNSKLTTQNSQLTTVAIKLNKLIFVAKLKQGDFIRLYPKLKSTIK